MNFDFNIARPWVFFIAIPLVILSIIPFLRLRKGRKLAVKRIVPLIIQILLITMVTALISGITIVETTAPPEQTDIVLVVDMSDSNSSMKDDMNEYIKSIHEGADANTRIGTILFGKGAYKLQDFEAPSIKDDYLSFDKANLDTSITDIHSALVAAEEMFKDDRVNKRVVLISDGRNTSAVEPWAAAQMLSDANIRLDAKYFDIANSDNDEVQLIEVSVAPRDDKDSTKVKIRVEAKSTADVRGKVILTEVMADGSEEVFHTFDDINFKKGEGWSGEFDYDAEGEGIHSVYAKVLVDSDTIEQNNRLYEWFKVDATASFLIIEGSDDQADLVEDLLKDVDETYSVTVKTTKQFPDTMEELLEYDEIILMNVNLKDLGNSDIEHLRRYVNEVGRGLVYTAGQNSYKVSTGGNLADNPLVDNALADILPIELEIKPVKQTVATVIAIDLSSSMHKLVETDTNGNKITRYDMVLESVKSCIEQMNYEDYVGVVVFSGTAEVVVEVTQVSEVDWILEEVDKKFEEYFFAHDATGARIPDSSNDTGYKIKAKGTSYYEGISTGRDLLADFEADLRQFIFVSDGEPGDLGSGYDGIISNMNTTNGVVTSTIAIGNDSATANQELQRLAALGKGKFTQVMSKLNLSDSLFEAATSIQGGYINEMPFQPFVQNGTSPVFEGISSAIKMKLPELGGYFGTTTKTNATLTISADDKNRPIVAEWQPPDSLGYVTVFMSDLGTKEDWAENWYNDKEGKILITNILLNSFKQLESKVDTSGIIIERDDVERTGGITTLSVTLNKRLRKSETLDDGTIVIGEKLVLEVTDPNGNTYTPDVKFVPVANKKYSVKFDTPDSMGMYTVTVKLVTDDVDETLQDKNQIAVVGFYESEYDVFNLSKKKSTGKTLLKDLSLTGGGILAEDAEAFYEDFSIPDFVEYKHSPLYAALAAAIILYVLEILCRHVKTRKQKKAEQMTDEEQILSMRGR